ncbi:transcriptional regulator with XRE-family HTH domain [Catenulispora sp. GAS73]
MEGQNALGDFLRSRRDRLRPQDVGMATGGRRRTPGLRREEVALLAALSTDYYSRLEQGRVKTPSEAALASLARAMRLSRDEQHHLFRLAGQRPPQPYSRRASRPDRALRKIAKHGGEVVLIDGTGDPHPPPYREGEQTELLGQAPPPRPYTSSPSLTRGDGSSGSPPPGPAAPTTLLPPATTTSSPPASAPQQPSGSSAWTSRPTSTTWSSSPATRSPATADSPPARRPPTRSSPPDAPPSSTALPTSLVPWRRRRRRTASGPGRPGGGG